MLFRSKLPILFAEFAESARYSGTKTMFESAEHLQKMTPMFWEKYVRPKIEKDFQGNFRFLSDPYPDGPNAYLAAIEANIGRAKLVAADPAVVVAK